MANNYAGFTAQDLMNYFGGLQGALPGQSLNTAQALIDWQTGGHLTDNQIAMLNQLGPKQLGGPTGEGSSGNIAWGLQHLAEHPAGSHYHGDFNPTDLIANVATMGMYGMGKAGFNAVTGQQDLLGAARSGLNQLGPWGSTTSSIPKYGAQIAETGNLIGAGAGVGGAFGAPFSGALAGLSAEQMLRQFGGQPTPEGGAQPQAAPTATTPGGLNAQQIASLSAMNSQAHKGLAPSFEARMRGQSPGPGIAGDAFGQFNG